MKQSQRSLVNALLYADIFKYPLTKEEILKYATGTCTKLDYLAFLKNPPAFVHREDGLLVLREHKNYIKIRKERQKISLEKYKKALQITKILQIIPYCRFIGISGTVAMQNANEDDDIDLFIITSAGKIWTTRLLCSLIVWMLGKKRHKNEVDPKDKICLNMFMSEDKLNLGRSKKDLYTAHEILQVKMLINKNNAHQKFLISNNWVQEYLPQGLESWGISEKGQSKNTDIGILESLIKKVQLWYMEKSKTREEVSDTLLAFHPLDHRNFILMEYKKRQEKYGTI